MIPAAQYALRGEALFPAGYYFSKLHSGRQFLGKIMHQIEKKIWTKFGQKLFEKVQKCERWRQELTGTEQEMWPSSSPNATDFLFLRKFTRLEVTL